MMKWLEVFYEGIELGIKHDLRNLGDVTNLDNIYSDCSIIHGSNDLNIQNVYAGIDVTVAEILLAKNLIANGIKIDAVISHHPLSHAAYNVTDVAELQKYNWLRFGVSKKVAEKLLNKIQWDESIHLKSRNFLGVESAAKLLDIPVLCMHTALDNVVQSHMESLLVNSKSKTLGDSLELIKNIPECAMASLKGDIPYILNPNHSKRKLGKFLVDMTGGIDPAAEIFKYLKRAGVQSIIGMHYGWEIINSILRQGLNGIICGHMASDSIGLNMFCDILEKQGLKIIPGSGFYRIKR